MSRTFTIFSQRLAGWLMQRGFVLVALSEANAGDGRNVFHFNNTEELHEAINEYITQNQ